MSDNASRFQPIKPNPWAVKLGYLLGRGYSSTRVAKMLEDGTHPATVRGMARRAKILPKKPRQVLVQVEMPSWQRDRIEQTAEVHGLSSEEIMRRILECSLCIDDLYEAVTDGKFDGI